MAQQVGNTCCKAQKLDLDLQDPDARKKEQTPASGLLTSTHVP